MKIVDLFARMDAILLLAKPDEVKPTLQLLRNDLEKEGIEVPSPIATPANTVQYEIVRSNPRVLEIPSIPPGTKVVVTLERAAQAGA